LNFSEGFSDFSLKLHEAFTGSEEFFSFSELSSSVFSLTTRIVLIENVSILFQLVAKNYCF